jgi:hypothetical protein
MKLIILVLGLVLGAAGGIFYAVQCPEQAAKIAGKENDLIAQGKREALEAMKQKLDSILSDQSQPASTGTGHTPGSSFASGGISMPSSSSDQSAKIKSLRDDVTAQLNQIPAKK